MSKKCNKPEFYTYETVAVANHLLNMAREKRVGLNSTTLQTLIYYAHGLYMKTTDDTPLIGETIEARDYGPGIASLHSEFLEFENLAITRFAQQKMEMGVSEETGEEIEKLLVFGIPQEDFVVREILKLTFDMLISYPELLDMTMMESSPWFTARQSTKYFVNPPMDNYLIRDYVWELTGTLLVEQFVQAEEQPRKQPKRKRKSRRKR